jgi:hypothetical protein
MRRAGGDGPGGDVRTDYLDCCDQPTLEAVRTLHEADHDLEALLRCQHCQAFWFYRFHEYAAAGDDLTSWFTRLTDEEADRLRSTRDPAAVDVAFLTTRPSWMHDDQGPRPVPGQPSHPWS